MSRDHFNLMLLFAGALDLVVDQWQENSKPRARRLMELIEDILAKNGLVFAFLLVGLLMYVSFWDSKKLTNGKIPGVAIAISAGLMLAMLGEKKGIADIAAFSGMAFLGSSMLRDFTIVATALGASFTEIRKNGVASVLSLMLGLLIAFFRDM
jgi:malonate transporter MadM subunit